jgi:hypothetical protein
MIPPPYHRVRYRVHTGAAFNFNIEVPFTAWYSRAALDALPRGGLLYHEFMQGCGRVLLQVRTRASTRSHVPFMRMRARRSLR